MQSIWSMKASRGTKIHESIMTIESCYVSGCGFNSAASNACACFITRYNRLSFLPIAKENRMTCIPFGVSKLSSTKRRIGRTSTWRRGIICGCSGSDLHVTFYELPLVIDLLMLLQLEISTCKITLSNCL